MAVQHILLVDDDASIREFVSLALTDEGYDVVTAQNGAVALNLIVQYPPALILLDMRMPIMDGWEFARAYRQTPGSKAPIIMLTAATDAEAFATQVGADDFLAKPFGLDELLDMVSRFIGQDSKTTPGTR